MATGPSNIPQRRFGARDVGAYVAVAVGVLTITTALTSLVFQLVPGLKPVGPPNEISGRIEFVRMELNVPLRDYFDRVGLRSRGLSKADLGRRGVLVYVGYRLTGAKTEKPLIRAFWYHANGPRLPTSNQGGTKEIHLEPPAQLTRAVALEWLQLPPVPGSQKYRIHEELYYKHQLVDLADSGRIRCQLGAKPASQQCHL